MPLILKKLAGGDRRSIGRANEAVAKVLERPARIGELFGGLWHSDAVVRMRAADALEKVCAKRPELLQPFAAKLLTVAGRSEQQEVRWHAALMIPRLELTTRQRAAAADIFFEYLRDRSSIVRTWAMDALVRLAEGDADLRKRVVPLIEDLTETGTPAMRARGRKLLQHLNRRRVKE